MSIRGKNILRNWGTLVCCAFAALIIAGATTSQAATIFFSPSASTIAVGDSVSVDLVVSGLGTGAAPSLGVFDLSVAYSSSVLSASSVTFGDSVLGDQLDLFGFGSITDSLTGTSAGIQAVFELSFDFPSDLDSLQADSFVMATINFDAIAEGTSALEWSSYLLGDSFGAEIDVNTVGGSISIQNPVPEPSAAIVFATGFVVIAGSTRRRARRS